jgi:hypothetical protein
MRRAVLLVVLGLTLMAGGSLAVPAHAESGGEPPPPTRVRAEDTRNDPGESIDVSWELSPAEADQINNATGYAIERAATADGPYEEVGRIAPGETLYADNSVSDGTAYYYRVRTIGTGGATGEPSAVSGPVRSRGQWFDVRKTATLLFTAVFCLSVVLLIHLARRGRSFYVRPIPGLSAVDEAIGRATEMGRPILFVSGLGGSGDVATLAAFTLLGRVARKTAERRRNTRRRSWFPAMTRS